jgi:hypothetical protein
MAVARSTIVALVSLLPLAACGDDPKPKHKFAPAAAAEPGAEEAEGDNKELMENYIVLGVNPKWTPLQDLFDKYNERKIEGLENPMLSHLVDHVERPVIDQEKTRKKKEIATSYEVEDDRPEDHDPRTWMALGRYKLIILMTGIARPKAVIITPNGVRYVLVRGDPLGSEGGRVKAILQYKMLVAVPSETEPRIVTIEPPLARFAEEAGVSKDF